MKKIVNPQQTQLFDPFDREGTRTLNLRIDSPKFRFVSPCGKTINDGVKKSYEIDRRTTKD